MKCIWIWALSIVLLVNIGSTDQIEAPDRPGGSTSHEDIADVTLPSDFDWEAYIAYHPGVYDIGVVTEVDAIEHYMEFGSEQGLLHHRLNVILRYTACTGLINQIYSHIASLSLAIMLGTEVVLPPSAYRDSFANYFSVFKERNEMAWTPAPLSDLLDEDALISYWGARGVKIHKAQSVLPFPDLTQPTTAYVPYASNLAPEDCVARLDGVYAGTYDLNDLINLARHAIVEAAEKLESQTPGRRIDTMVLELPCTFFMLRTASHKHLVGAVAKSLIWAPDLQRLADKVVKAISAKGRIFNSLHLRLEKDARDWTEIMGGAQAIWDKYVSTMQMAGLGAGQDLYIASGLLSYGAENELEEKISALKNLDLCGDVHYKELYLSKSELKGLNSEQKALVDFLVLKEGYRFVGFGASTFSFYLRELRVLEGIPRSQSWLVDASEIRTDDLFLRAAVLS